MSDTSSTPNRAILFVKTAVRSFMARDITSHAQLIAYTTLFAVAPLLIFLTAFCGLIVQQVNADAANPVGPILEWLDEKLPPEAAEFLREPVESALTTKPGFLLSIGGLLTLWSARNAIGAVMKGLNVAYGIEETRPFLKRNGMTVLLTIGLAVAILVAGSLQFLSTSAGQDVADWLGIGSAWETAMHWLQWPMTIVLVTLIIVLIHRYAPAFDAPFRWYLPGALFTTIGLAVAILGLQIYFASLGGFSAAYGIFGAVLAFIFWLYVAGVVLLTGGLINATLFEMYPPAKTALAGYKEAKILGHPPQNA